MSRPDNELIAEVILYSEGFKSAKSLGHKLVAIFSLSSALLSTQQHYDWGLRALKTVLKGSGNLLYHEKTIISDNRQVSASKETELVVQALRLNTLSKLTFLDCKRFDQLVHDVFPSVEFKDIQQEQLIEALKTAAQDMNLEIIDSQIKKALELHEQLNQRMGVVIVGPSGSGKSSVWKILKMALNKLNQVVRDHTMNPKAMPRTQLLGHIDIDTREWTDGVLTSSARQVVRETDIHWWIVCDGDIDPEWIESLNSVLDDNRLLTMPSGERIQFGPNVNFLFETHDLSCASPATISRMGMIFLSNEDTDVRAIVKAWIKSHPVSCQLIGWIDDYFYQALDWMLSSGEGLVETTPIGLVMNGLSHLNGVNSKAEFACSLVRGLGGNLPAAVRTEFTKHVFSLTHESLPDPRHPLDTYVSPSTGRLATYQLQLPDHLSLHHFAHGSPPVIVTTDIQRNAAIILPWLRMDSREPFLLVGPEGCGKELLLNYCFSNFSSTSVATIHCSAQTSSLHIQQKLNQVCMAISTTTGRVYRPKDCERLILYLKDLNLPKPDKWGTSQIIAFLQQVLTYNGFYADNLEWVGLEGIQIIASINPSGSLGHHSLSTRFTAIVRLCCVDYPSTDQLQAVYSAYLQPVLHHSLHSHPFWSSVAKIHSLANSMINVYEKVRSKFTVDDHSHYIFTPRDLTRWVFNLLRYPLSDDSTSPQGVLHCWAYEAARLFRDKLIGRNACMEFDGIINSVLRSDWSTDLPSVSNYYVTWGSTHASEGVARFGKPLGKLTTSDLADIVHRATVTYGREHFEMNILIFQEVLDHISRIDKVLGSPGGSLLLAGSSGAGRRTAVKLVAHMYQMDVVTPHISRNYSVKNFKNDLKQVMQKAGINGEDVVLLLEDHQLLHPSFLEMINSLLSSGEIPGLYTPEELEPLLAPLKDLSSEESYRGSLMSYYISRVMKHLHVVLIMDLSSSEFVAQCQANPALYTCCTFQCMDRWSNDTMAMLPSVVLSGVGSGSKVVLDKSNIDDNKLSQFFLSIHQSCVQEGATPLRFINFLKTYQAVYVNKKEGLTKQLNRLQAGVNKLNEATSLVDELKVKAAAQRNLLSVKQGEADDALQQITVSMQAASQRKTEMEVIQQKQSEERTKLEQRKKAIDIELSEIEPLVAEARKAVGNIKPAVLAEIRALNVPPTVIRDILEGVLCIMGIYDTSFSNMRTFLGRREVKEDIMDFDARKITPEIRKNVQQLLEKNKNSFEASVAKRASAAAAPLAAWVKANAKYSQVLENIGPLEKEKASLQGNLEKSERQLVKLSQGLEELDKEVSSLRLKFDQLVNEAAKLKLEVEREEEIISTAENLVEKLKGEHQRWTKQVEELVVEMEHLPRYSLLAAAFLTYLSKAPEDERRLKMNMWKEMIGLQSFQLKSFLSTEKEQLLWKANGLPSDDLSIENALIILQGQQCPLLIDPSQQATTWLKTHLKESRLEVINQQDANFTTSLELAVRFGKTLIIQEVDGVEPLLFPLLRQDLISHGPRYVVQMGDKLVDYNENFSLYLTTRSPNLDIPPFASSIISEINFTTTRAGLTSQLLAATIKNEMPELEERKTALLKSEEDLKVQLASLEESLLQELASAEGNILENKALLDSLNETKAKSSTITQSLLESVELQKTLNKERDAYLSLAEYSSDLFFIVSSLSKLNNMYQFSLSSFVRLFKRALCNKEHMGNTELRLRSLKSTFESLIYQSVCRSLFKADCLMFALHLVHGVRPELFQDKEWEVFTGQMVDSIFRRQESIKQIKDTIPSWCNPEQASQISSLKTNFPTLYNNLELSNATIWAAFSRSSQCERDFPPSVVKKITPFQQVLTIQALQPDRLQSSMEHFIHYALSIKELYPSSLNLKKLYTTETLPTEPILLIISPGTDPSQELQELAEEIVGGDNYHQVAMGQGQANKALELLNDCAANGQWLCLKNLHLVIPWLSVLENKLNSLQPHDNFRLWLTTEAHVKFPHILLQNSLKVTYESPPGIKRNLQRTYESWTQDYIEEERKVARAQTLFVLSWFHAVVQERRVYIPQGWSKFYEFSMADLRAACNLIDRLSVQGDVIQWDFMKGLMENAIYGGRVDNTYDMRVLISYLRQFFNSGVITGQTGHTHQLSRNPTVGLPIGNIPVSTKQQDYTGLITSLPDYDKPSYFGLPANIDRSRQRTVSSQVVSQLRLLQRSEATTSKFDREAWSQHLSPILNLWKKLNQV
jgi:dynein heavy chain 2